MFGALMEMLQRPHILPVIGFVLIFKLGDASMGFMVKPFWVDAGFSATQIGLVSVNLGLVLSIAGGIAGGWFTDRVGIFKALWILGLFQALSNLGYVWAASAIPLAVPGTSVAFEQQMIIYSASAMESFTGGLGTAAFLAFLMAIVNQQHSATEYALLSSVFALSRQLAGYASGFGAHYMGYAPYFLLTFFLSFPGLSAVAVGAKDAEGHGEITRGDGRQRHTLSSGSNQEGSYETEGLSHSVWHLVCISRAAAPAADCLQLAGGHWRLDRADVAIVDRARRDGDTLRLGVRLGARGRSGIDRERGYASGLLG